MYEFYDEAVEAVTGFLDEGEYSTSVRCSHSKCFRELKKYLIDINIPYTHELALDWLTNNKGIWTHAKFKSFRIATYRLDDAYCHGAVTQEKYVYPDSPPYQRLPTWARVKLDRYLDLLGETAGKGHMQAARVGCADFLMFASESGVSQPGEINAETVMGYHRAMAYELKSTRALRLLHSRAFLKSLAIDGEVSPVAAMLMSEHFTSHLPAYEPIAFETMSPMTSEPLGPEEFLEKVECFITNILPAHSYSRTIKKTYKKALRMLFVFLSLNELSYSYEQAIAWVEANKAEFGTGWKTYRRAVFLFEQFRIGGDIDPDTLYSAAPSPVELLPSWAADTVRAFLFEKQREGYARSTLYSYRSACCRFAHHAADHGIADFEQLTPGVVLAFCLEDPHSTSEARACYVSKVRSFLEFLSDRGIAARDLHLATPRESAVVRRCVEVLDESQIVKCHEARIQAKTPMELRHAAIVSVGLWTGLRASDIVGLRLNDISWTESTITVVQQKTGVLLTLPLLVQAGNAILAYLREGRPTTPSPFLFVKHKVPFTQLTTTACRKALQQVLGDIYASCGGFHVLRRTFATRMLRGDIGARQISAALGHSADYTLHKYLALDPSRMRACALPLDNCRAKDNSGGGF